MTMFPFVHPTIGVLLQCHLVCGGGGGNEASSSACPRRSRREQQQEEPYYYQFLDTKRLEIKPSWVPPDSSLEASGDVLNLQQQQDDDDDERGGTKNTLIHLALECDEFVFQENGLHNNNNNTIDSAIQKMMDWGRGVGDDVDSVGLGTTTTNTGTTCLLASLLATNRLEAAIRQACGYTTAGRAPLLKNMIQQLDLEEEKDTTTTTTTNNDDNKGKRSVLVSVLRTLLLPTPGLNLRNLCWHGFVATIPRPWLALVLVLIVILERDYHQSNSNATKVSGAAAAVAASPTGGGGRSSSSQQIIVVELPRIRSFAAYQPIIKRGEELRRRNLKDIDVSWITEETNPFVQSTTTTTSNGVSNSNEEVSPPKEKSSANLDDDGTGGTGSSSCHFYSYKGWWRLVQHWIATKQNYPICICILLTCLLEHGLRQLWCQENHRPQDKIARPGVFYVTLDGQGQRYKHDVLLHPYVGGNDDDDDLYTTDHADADADTNTKQQSNKNLLMDRLGAPIMALLTDLYCSPCGGPNLRASLAHGLWDELLLQELSTTSVQEQGRENNDEALQNVGEEQQMRLWDMVSVLFVLMEAIGKAVVEESSKPTKSAVLVEHSAWRDYRPIFSYTAATCRNLESAMSELRLLQDSLPNNDVMASAKASVTNLRLDEIHNLKIVTLENLLQQAECIKQRCCHGYYGGNENNNNNRPPWTTKDILHEHETNKVLSSLGAARTLLQEVGVACSSYRLTLIEKKNENEVGASSSRKRKQYTRILAASELATILYQFAALTAILLLEHDLNANNIVDNDRVQCHCPSIDRNNLVQAVKRSRMVISTVSNFITANIDRATKSAKEYSKGKVVKAIIQHYQREHTANS